MSSVLAIDAQQAKCLYDGINSLYLKGSNLYLFDGEQEVMFEGGKDGKNGTDGADGSSAFEIWVNQQEPRDEPYTIAEFFEALKGADGADGSNGADGLSAFEIWVNQQTPRQEPYTVAEFLESIKGNIQRLNESLNLLIQS